MSRWTIKVNHTRKTLALPRCLLGVCWLLVATGCASISYYHQAITGHLSLLSKRTPNDVLIKSGATDPRLVEQLKKIEALKQFADTHLGLPADGQYSSYVDTGKPFVVWNVFAAPEFSLAAKQWCYPVIGCAAYRGYYDRTRAERYAEKLADKGWDVYVGGSAAYSTLGWFEDPILNTFVYRNDSQLADLLFHELAHHKLYINGDSRFNESFASLVARVGVKRWHRDQRARQSWERYLETLGQHEQFVSLVADYRTRLGELYARDGLSIEEKRVLKGRIFSELKARHEDLKATWGGQSRYTNWFNRPLNNAQLNTVATYNQWVPALNVLLAQHDDDLETFYTATSELKKLSQAERDAYLAELDKKVMHQSR